MTHCKVFINGEIEAKIAGATPEDTMRVALLMYDAATRPVTLNISP